jgi:hypothetical protein
MMQRPKKRSPFIPQNNDRLSIPTNNDRLPNPQTMIALNPKHDRTFTQKNDRAFNPK